jgi:hypothetical protein
MSAVLMESRLQADFQFYRANQADFVGRYNGKFIVLKDFALLGVYETHAEAIRETMKHHELGTFLVQQVTPGDSATTARYHSRATFR